MQGILIINKPKEYTSQDVVSKVKKILNIKKAGHTGTLDPMATGVLPILLGNYTKLSKYLIEHDKTYIAKIKLGEKKDTGDSEGITTEESYVSEKCFEKNNIEETLKRFLGKQKQVPPVYSAIKVNGKKLYEYAREGKKVNIEPRDIEIYDIFLKNIFEQTKEIEIQVSCSKGTYIRVLCENIAEKLETVGYMSSLERIKVDRFSLNDALTFDELEGIKDKIEILNKKLVKMEDLFNTLPKITLNKRKQELFLNGVKLTYELEDGIYNIYSYENKYLGTGIIKEKLLKRDIIIEE